jgi:hypothetical protein
LGHKDFIQVKFPKLYSHFGSLIIARKPVTIYASVAIAAQPLLNGALNEDTLDDGWVRIMIHMILQVSDNGA